MNKKKKAIILSSGGLDSTTAMAVAKDEGFDLYSLSFDYGQRHRLELEASQKIADHMGVARHLIININMRDIGGSALTDDVAVPKKKSFGNGTDEIPITYVPARNTIFLSFALAWAEVICAEDIISVEVRPPIVIGDLFRRRGFAQSFALKLDLADFFRHVAIHRRSGWIKHIRITPDDPDVFVSICRSIMTKKEKNLRLIKTIENVEFAFGNHLTGSNSAAIILLVRL